MDRFLSRRDLLAAAGGALLAPAAFSLAPKAAAEEPETGYLDKYQHWVWDKYGDIWPTDGSIIMKPIDGGCSTVVRFGFDLDTIDAIQQIASKFEIHFLLGGYRHSGINRRSKITSNLPTGEKMRTLVDEEANESTLRWGYGYTKDLKPDRLHRVSMRFWDARKVRGLYQWVSVRMVLTNGEDDNHPVIVYWTRGLEGDVLHPDRGERKLYW